MIPGSANPLLLAPAGGGYQISRSLRFNSADSAYLSRTPAVAGNRTTWTWAGWLKRSGTSRDVLLAQWSGLGFAFEIDSSSRIDAYDYTSGYDWHLISTPVYRDPSAWYHIVFAYDTTQATASNRIKLYINGTQVTTFSTATYPSPSYAGYVNTASAHEIGGAFGVYLDGYLADIHFIDGQALTPSSFTEVSATTGQLIPKAYSGSFGTNGFWLKFSDNSAATAAALGNDYSGNNNDWTPNNLSVTAGAGNDSLVDTPTSYGTDTGAGGEVRGNYATLNPNMTRDSFITYSNGNLDFTQAASTGQAQQMSTQATIGVASGKWYWEVTKVSTDNIHPGVAVSMDVAGDVVPSAGYLFYQKDGTFSASGFTLPSSGASQTAGDVIGVALDADNRTVQFFKNGASQGTATNGPTGQTWFPSTAVWTSSASGGATCNFGQRAFAYTAPSGFKALCDTNLGAPVVAKPNTVMDVALYTGNGSTQTISGLGFSPDLVWIKPRSQPYHGALYDVIRGTGKILYSSLTNSEDTYANSLTAFNSDGFSLGADGSNTSNSNGTTHVAWTWDAGTSTVSNTSGSITSQVRANASAGFSVVTYPGDRTSAGNSTIGHGLGVAPGLVITKSRSNSSRWVVQHSSLGSDDYLELNTTAAVEDSVSVGAGALPKPTSTVFYASWISGLNVSGQTFVAYCFAPVVGYSSFGSYTGNGSADGPFVYTGMRPRWLLIKDVSSGSAFGNWMIKDALRPSYNTTTGNLYANAANAEDNASSVDTDILSNGFKLRGTYGGINTNAVTYIYAAFAESPFAYARAR